MSNDATIRAAQALLVYRRGDGPADPRARELCRRLAEAIDSGGSVGPKNTSSPTFLTLALEMRANGDPGIRALVAELAAAMSSPASPEARGPSQSAQVVGDGNVVHIAGRDLHFASPGPNFMLTGSSSGGRRRNLLDEWTEQQGGRHIEPRPASLREPPITVLFAAASPDDTEKLRVEKEMREVREALELSHGRDRFRLEVRPAQRPHDFTRALLQLRPRVVHFSGHGIDQTGEICFEDNAGFTVAASPQGLRGIFAGLGGAVECVLLNACFSQQNAEAIAESVPYVIGNPTAVDDEAAIAFSVGFYQALGAGMGIPEAHGWGCSYMQVAGLEEPLPVLVRGAAGSGGERR